MENNNNLNTPSNTSNTPSNTSNTSSGSQNTPSNTPSNTSNTSSNTGNTSSVTGNTPSVTGNTSSGTGNTPTGTRNTSSNTGNTPSGTGNTSSGTGNTPSGTNNTSTNNRNRQNKNTLSNNKPVNTSSSSVNRTNTQERLMVERNNTNKNSRSLTEKASNKVKELTTTVKSRLIETSGLEGETLMFILKTVLAVLVLLALFYVSRYYYSKYTEMVYNSPYLLDGIKNAKRSLVVSQDPKNSSYIPISKSENQDGIQFTYDFWILVETFDYKPGQWKHVFHKGNASGYPNRAPGIWLHPSTNALRFYMNTQENILEYVDVENIPARKWMHISLVLDDKDMDVYVNGYLKSRKKLSSVPKQNNGDFWCNMFGGFEGFMARIRYYARAISPEEILSNVRLGPGDTKCLDGSDVPAYLDDNWWYDV